MKHKSEFETFFKTNQTLVFRIVRGYVRDRSIAEDITLDAFMKVYDRFERVKGFENPVGYLVRIAVNGAKTYLKKGKKTVLSDTFEIEVRSPHSSPEDRALLDEETGWIEQQMSLLKDIERNIIIMKDIDRKKFQEIADILEQKLPTIKSLYRRAKIKLSAEMEKEYAV